MKKAVILLVAMVSVLISGCSYEPIITKEYTYIGENENWTGEYKVNYLVTFPKKDGKVYSDRKERDILIINYKGDISKLSAVKHSEISYKHSSGGGTSTADYDSPMQSKVFRFRGGSGSKSQIGEYPMTAEQMRNAFILYGGSYTACFDEKIEVDIDLDGNTEHFELLPSESSNLASLDFEQIKADLSRWRLPETYISHIDYSNLALELIDSKATITNEKNSSVLYYDFTIQNTGNKTVGRIKNFDDLQIEIIPNKKLIDVYTEIYGMNRLNNFINDLGHGLSIDGDFLNTNKECDLTFSYDLATREEDLLALRIMPSADQLEKLQRNALDASLLILYKDTEIARFDLNKNGL